MDKIISAQFISLKMLLEGIEIPVVSVQIQETINRPASCVVNVGLKKYANRVLPGTIMHLFCNEDLIFEGIFVGLQTQKAAGSKSVSMIFQGLLGVFDQAWLWSFDFNPASVRNKVFFTIVSDYTNFGTHTKKAQSQTAISDVEVDPETGASVVTTISIPSTNLSAVSPFGSILQELINDMANGNQSLETSLMGFINNAIAINPYLAKLNRTLKITERIKIFNNGSYEIKKLLEGLGFRMQLLHELQNDVDDVMSLSKILGIVCNYLGYEIVNLAAPSVIDGKPISIIIKPKMFFMAPISCNIVFPNQAANINIDENYLSCPTRYSTQSAPALFRQKNTAFTGFFLTISPSVAITMGNAPLLAQTSEELFRGPLPIQEPQADFLAQTYVEKLQEVALRGEATTTAIATLGTVDFNSEEASKVEDLTSTLSGTDYARQMQAVADKRFFELRATSKKGSFVINYSPYRLVGFQGVLLDEELPTYMGVFSSITSTLDANGSATQTISLNGLKPFCLDELYHTYTENYEDFLPELPIYYSAAFKANSIGDNYYSSLINTNIHSLKDLISGEDSLIRAGVKNDGKDYDEPEDNFAIRRGLYHALKRFKENSSNEYFYTLGVNSRKLFTSEAFKGYLNVSGVATDEEVEKRDEGNKLYMDKRQRRVKFMMGIT